jgi:TatD DNase family protein
MIDTHCHLTNSQLAHRLDEVLHDAQLAGVHTIISVSTDGDDALAARQIAEHNKSVYFSSGIHPLYADGDWKWGHVREAARDEKCVAWGELGLDRHYSEPSFSLQEKLLEEHIALIEAEKSDSRPIIVHCRRAVDDLLPVFKASSLDGNRFVFHCFTEGTKEVNQILDFGAMVSFTGVVTYKNATEVLDAARLVPIDRIMVETDAPYLSPEPVRKVRPNEPKNVVHTAARLAETFDLSLSEFETKTDQNAREFFNLPDQR